MRILTKKLLRELNASRGLLLLVSSIIAVGITCFVAMQSAYHNLKSAQRQYYQQSRMADFWIDLKRIPIGRVDQLMQLPGISEVLPRIQSQATVDLENTFEPVNGLVISLPDQRLPVLNDILIQQGDYFTGGNRREILVNEKFARVHRLYPGQRLHLLLNHQRIEFLIVGTAISSEFTYLVGSSALLPDPEHFGVFYLPRSVAEDVMNLGGAANQIVGRFAPGASQRAEELLQVVERRLEPYGVFATTRLEQQTSNQFLSSEIDGLGSFAAVLPVIFLTVAALVLNVLVNRLARRQRSIVGTLKALGYSDGVIFRHFLYFALSVGLVGGLLGCLSGYLSATGMTYIYRWFFEFPELRSQFHWRTHAIGLVVSLLCSGVGGLHAARQMLRLRAAEAMRPEPPHQGGAIWLERLLGSLWQRLGAGTRMALRSTVRHRLRTATALFAAMMGSALLVAGFMMIESQEFLLEFQFEQEARSDIDLVFESEEGGEVLAEIAALTGVDYVEPVLTVACTFEHGPYRRKGSVTGLRPRSRLTAPRDRQGAALPIPTHGIVVTQRMAEILHLRPGSLVTMVPVKGNRRPLRLPVQQVASTYMGLAVYADIGYLSRLVDEGSAVSGAQLLVDQDSRTLSRLYAELNEMPGIQAVQSRRDMIENLRETLLQNQYVFIGVLVAFAGIIFFGSIVNASMVNLAERQREVATLQALGYSGWQVGAVFFRESFGTTLLGATLGLPVGYLLTWLTAVSYNNDVLRLPVVTATWIWGTTLLAAALFGVLAHAVVQWRIQRVAVLEALKINE